MSVQLLLITNMTIGRLLCIDIRYSHMHKLASKHLRKHETSMSDFIRYLYIVWFLLTFPLRKLPVSFCYSDSKDRNSSSFDYLPVVGLKVADMGNYLL